MWSLPTHARLHWAVTKSVCERHNKHIHRQNLCFIFSLYSVIFIIYSCYSYRHQPRCPFTPLASNHVERTICTKSTLYVLDFKSWSMLVRLLHDMFSFPNFCSFSQELSNISIYVFMSSLCIEHGPLLACLELFQGPQVGSLRGHFPQYTAVRWNCLLWLSVLALGFLYSSGV